MADLVISDRLADDGGTGNGAIYLEYGPVTSTTSVGASGDRLVGGENDLGLDNATAGDYDNDGVGDLAAQTSTRAEAWLSYGPFAHTGVRYSGSADASFTGPGVELYPGRAGRPAGAAADWLELADPNDDTWLPDAGAVWVFEPG